MAMRVFQPYDPQSSQRKPSLRACEACYTRKVRCDTGGHAKSCQNCVAHGVECRPRNRKRKSAALAGADGPTAEVNGHGENGIQEVSRRKVDEICVYKRRDDERRADKSIEAPMLFVTHLKTQTETVSPRTASSIDAFHNSSYLSRSAILGDEFPDIDHSHTDRGIREHTLSSTDMEVLKLYHAFDLPDPPLRQSLIEAYVERCWTWMPVVNLSSLSGSFAAGEDSLLLLQAVLLVGSLMRPELCSKETVDDYYRKVKALVNSGHERNPVNILASLCLIQWYTPTAPKDISTDTPRFWATYALGLAQQMGLHKAAEAGSDDYGLRRRIWWTLKARDNVIAAAHGRPRVQNPIDCTVTLPDTSDFEDPSDRRALIFAFYVQIAEILGDLCQLLSREGKITTEERKAISTRLRDYMVDLPDGMRLQNYDGSARPYDLQLAQFHVVILTTITILYRPRSIFALGPANAASITAANMTFRIVQAIHYREHTKFLSSAFAWYLLAASIPHLSCLRVEKLKMESSAALDTLEMVLSTLAKVRPAAANNLRNVRAIRRAVSVHNRADTAQRHGPDDDSGGQESLESYAGTILQQYGPDVLRHYHSLFTALDSSNSTPTFTEPNYTNPSPHASEEQQQQQANGVPLLEPPESFTVETPVIPLSTPAVPLSTPGYDDAFTSLFEDDIQGSMSFWMRDWMEDLQYLPE